MVIEELRGNETESYNKLALSNGNIFNTIEWTEIFGSNITRYGIYDKGNRLIGGFVLYNDNKFGLSVYRNPPFTPCLGPFLNIEAQNPVSIINTWKKVLSLITDLLEKKNSSLVTIALNNNITDMQPFIWSKYKVVPGYTYILDLSLSEDELLKRMSGERRKNIKKSLSDGLLVKPESNLSVIKSLALKTFSRQGEKISEHYLDKILFQFANKSNSFSYVTYNEGTPISCTFCIHDRSSAFYILGGYDDKNKHHGAGALAMWESIKHSRALGLKQFDFEGSMIPQIETYFRGFGGMITPYFKVNKAKLPIEIILKFFKRELF